MKKKSQLAVVDYTMTDFGLLELRIAIIKRAILDYEEALMLPSNRRDKQQKIDDLERFFLSEYGNMLMEDKGRECMAACRERVANNNVKRHRRLR